MITDEATGKCVGILSDGLRINCQKLVMRGQSCPTDLKQVKKYLRVTPIFEFTGFLAFFRNLKLSFLQSDDLTNYYFLNSKLKIAMIEF